MTNTVLLNNVDHQDLRVETRHSARFDDNVNQVPVFPTEFADIQREYPIFLRRDDDGAFLAIALLGLDRDENLFLDENAGWQARYIPAIQQRGPFLIGFQDRETEDGQSQREPMILVDLDHPRVCNGDGRGQPVFLEHGGNTAYLDHIVKVLGRIHTGMEAAGEMYAAFEAAGLIEPVAVELKLSDTETYTVPDLFAISEERLAALDGETLERLNAAGHLGAAFLMASSLGNVSRLIDMKNRARGGR